MQLVLSVALSRDESRVYKEDYDEKNLLVSNAQFSTGSPGATTNTSLLIVTSLFF